MARYELEFTEEFDAQLQNLAQASKLEKAEVLRRALSYYRQSEERDGMIKGYLPDGTEVWVTAEDDCQPDAETLAEWVAPE